MLFETTFTTFVYNLVCEVCTLYTPFVDVYQRGKSPNTKMNG